MMETIRTRLPGVLLFEPPIYRDARGYFLETWNQDRYAAAGLPSVFVQDNVSFSARGVLRGLHYQYPHPQGKLLTVLQGEIFDVAIDIRTGSPYFAQWEGVVLSASNGRQLYVPEGFAHGFVVLSETALVTYKCTAFYQPQYEASLRWDDPDLGIAWPIAAPILSPKDQAAPRLRDLATERLPPFEPGGETGEVSREEV
jgi:dTDP-4-dehydrorhamnose 3,5-epimerase